jgi:hypothetical protein
MNDGPSRSIRRGLTIAPFETLASPQALAELAAEAEAAGCPARGRGSAARARDDDGRAGELSRFGEELEPRRRGAMLTEGLQVLTGLLSGETIDHQGEHYRASGVGFI